MLETITESDHYTKHRFAVYVTDLAGMSVREKTGAVSQVRFGKRIYHLKKTRLSSENKYIGAVAVTYLRFQKLLFVAFLGLFAPDVFSHGPVGHQGCSGESPNSCVGAEVKAPADEFRTKLQEINKRYVEQIKPIFREKCGDCHSTRIRLPWYYPIPGVRQLIDRDHREAMKHLDISADFPFGGHGTPKEDLRAIQESIRKDSMPPFRYRVLHRNSKLTAEEEKAVMDWAASGETFLAK
ncbi:MAG: heme-binding domain-containing protein [Deltaproteobacteria bacterium]|nr:heme-binding domain-containing protein [Deltaproteobacteria bacterium]